jgi:thiamine-phosphate pyrophosphorylase
MRRHRPVLCLVTNSKALEKASKLPLPQAVAEAVAGGVDWIQIREDGLTDAELLDLSQQVSDAARSAGPVKIWMNRRLDIALAIKADGLLLGSTSIPAESAASFRASLCASTKEQDPRLALSLATHSEAEIAQAREGGVDYVQLAPVFPPLSKPASRPPLGLDALARAVKNAPPLLAQGGITPEHCAALIQAGCAGVAVTGGILQESKPRLAAQAFRDALDRFC